MSIRIKICGVAHVDDAKAAVDAGADLVGLNFVPESPRCLDLATAEAISRAVDGGAERVGIFRDAQPEEIERVLRTVDLDRIQFHGDESEEDCEEVDLPVIKALRGADLDAAEAYPGTPLLLLDNPTAGGGQGKAWNWSDASRIIERGYDVILAGGLDPTNVGEALEALGDLLPWGVDVATGVEDEVYRKDPAKMTAFVAAVRKAETSG